MKLFKVEHMRGVAGVDETEVEIFDDVEAESPEAAIREFTDWPDGKNPDATNRSGSYCDYWMATAQNGERCMAWGLDREYCDYWLATATSD
jgi:hypothetical protein